VIGATEETEVREVTEARDQTEAREVTEVVTVTGSMKQRGLEVVVDEILHEGPLALAMTGTAIVHGKSHI